MARWSMFGLVSLVPSMLLAQQSVIRGRITETRSSRPVASTVELRASDTTIVREGAATYSIGSLPSGRFELVVRAIGYQSLTMRVELAENDTLEADVVLERIPTKLPKVRTDSAGLPEGYVRRLADFNERRAFGFGRFLDWQFFEKNNHRRLGEILDGRFPGLKVDKTGGTTERLTTRRSGQFCPPQVFVNGILDNAFDLGLVSTAEVLGFEFYTPTNTPAQFNRSNMGGRTGVLSGDMRGAACGTVIFWLK
jgi:hypothetical protein